MGACYLFSCLVVLAGISSTMLKRSGGNGHLCLSLNLKGNAFNFSSLSMMLVVGFPYVGFIILSYIPSICSFLRDFLKS
jgi:hypothetical protein